MSETVGIVVLGLMGWALAERLAGQGQVVHGWTRSGADPAKAASTGIKAHSELTNLVATCDILITSLFDDAAVREVLAKLATFDLSGKLVVDTSTVSPRCVRDLESAINAAGGQLVDAPIAGGPEMVAVGTVGFLAGGDGADVERFRAVAEHASPRVVHVGKLGDGAAAKIVNNAALAGAFQATIDALDVGEALGLDLRTMLGFLENGPGITPMFKARIPKMLGEDDTVGFALSAVRKDMEVFLDVANAENVTLPSIQRMLTLIQSMPEVDQGDDPAALIRERFKQR